MTDNLTPLLPCPFCGGDARNDAHADDCYFILHKAMVNAPNADLSMVPDVLKAWNRRAALAQAQRLPDVPDLCDPSCGTYDLASMILSDCGHSTNNQRLLDRVAARIDKRIAAVLAASPQPQPVQPSDPWLPIETAPKDGTALLVSEGRFIYCVEWNEEFEWWAVDDNKLGPFRLRGAAPTHWAPLPPAPQPKD